MRMDKKPNERKRALVALPTRCGYGARAGAVAYRAREKGTRPDGNDGKYWNQPFRAENNNHASQKTVSDITSGHLQRSVYIQ